MPSISNNHIISQGATTSYTRKNKIMTKFLHKGIVIFLLSLVLANSPILVNALISEVNLRSSFRHGLKLNTIDRKTHLRMSTTPLFSEQKTASSTEHSHKYQKIPDEEIQKVKTMADIVKVIESHNLPMFTHTGPNKAKALCPFHDDRNPSLSIDGSRQIFKCFSCGKGGDVFAFVREYRFLRDGGEKMSFAKSIQVVAEEFTDGVNFRFQENGVSIRKNLTEAELTKIRATAHSKKRYVEIISSLLFCYRMCS